MLWLSVCSCCGGPLQKPEDSLIFEDASNFSWILRADIVSSRWLGIQETMSSSSGNPWKRAEHDCLATLLCVTSHPIARLKVKEVKHPEKSEDEICGYTSRSCEDGVAFTYTSPGPLDSLDR